MKVRPVSFLIPLFLLLLSFQPAASAAPGDRLILPGAPSLLLLPVVDSSRADYGDDLVKTTTRAVRAHFDTLDIIEARQLPPGLDNATVAERDELREAARTHGADRVLFIEILPVPVKNRDSLFADTWVAELSLAVKYYDFADNRYLFRGVITAKDGNRAILVGKVGTKGAVEGALNKVLRLFRQQVPGA